MGPPWPFSKWTRQADNITINRVCGKPRCPGPTQDLGTRTPGAGPSHGGMRHAQGLLGLLRFENHHPQALAGLRSVRSFGCHGLESRH